MSSPSRRPPQRGFADVHEERFAHALGWLAAGIGAAQLLAPRAFGRAIGVGARPWLMRWRGLGELAVAAGVLRARNPAWALWSKSGRDLVDAGMLAAALFTPSTGRVRAALALGAVLARTALDAEATRRVARHPRARVRERARGGIVSLKDSRIVNRSPRECYEAWRRLEDLPRTMSHLIEVREIDEKRSHWIARGPAGGRIEWDAEIVDDVPGERIAWRSLPGADVPNAGTVRFEAAPGGRGTILRVHLQYHPKGGEFVATIATLTGRAPDAQLREDLRRFKQMLEAGEVASTEGQPSGRRSPVGRLAAQARP